MQQMFWSILCPCCFQSVDLNLAIPETPNPVKVVDITTPLTTNPVNLEVLDETLVLQSGELHCHNHFDR